MSNINFEKLNHEVLLIEIHRIGFNTELHCPTSFVIEELHIKQHENNVIHNIIPLFDVAPLGFCHFPTQILLDQLW